MTYVVGRIQTELAELTPVAIVPRVKSEESIFHKLQTGRYASLDDIDDLVALKVVLLYRRQMTEAQAIIEGSNLTVTGPTSARALPPTDFGFHEPKISVLPPPDYLARNSDVQGIVTEVQFTTALQHALDMATHGFDYKGPAYSWGRFRLVAQLRGTLELVDRILDDMESSAVLASNTPTQPPEFHAAEAALRAIQEIFDPQALPKDLRRMTDSVLGWVEAAGVDPAELTAVLSRHKDLTDALSVDPTSAVLGALLREKGEDLVANYSGKLLITSELESICIESEAVPIAMRVSLS